ncbi:nitrite/sulfite reductase [Polynucleobacter paneuropaeus]|uniref:nitrite/sulfite reductase n=1 Tax=Polynucleobacter paneuropaeus TaxID=2527775 RepID=UPI001BFD5960|nr:nitrite/sulfite reductase [Polynucleobacter paneuropaeus]MBT8634584.1 nitrite/sulfite reductase [Polynucleobacter paneuropaeus]QWD51314.1 nitrite/sulfite reductase [Polynucleobacter paneuropaeus]QWD54529.1 nitrite/sulfite reductase [Polynucleobacter paneuropaeus]QWD56236.1 nitrite/sulfite reductase [Polynucleobacter paneuropaeus]
MYKYDYIDQTLVNERVTQFKDQVQRRIDGSLPEEEFRPLRLQNGLYHQRHAYMLRVAIPYGLLSSEQLRTLANISEKYDRGYGHFTTRQNIQFNWIKLEESPAILADLAKVQMHAIQTSGNCIRNITSDAFAGVAGDEYVDPRPICELLRQWSTLHPEFAHLPRKFKFAINGAKEDRTILLCHDVGIELKKNSHGELVADICAGGGMGRSPILGSLIKQALPWQLLPSYLTALLRVYNRFGRRDNLYKARIKILVKALGPEEFARQVEGEWLHIQNGDDNFTLAEWDRVAKHFTKPAYQSLTAQTNEQVINLASEADKTAFARWLERNVKRHQVPGYASVILSLKPHGSVAPGDATTAQMYDIADLADQYSFGELRATHEQNLVLADVEQAKLYELWQEAKKQKVALPNVGLLTDIIACPGGDFCSLANAKSLPIAKAIQERFDDLDYLFDLGDISLNISGCINSCGHHHVGNIGVLGVDKDGKEWYQITLGGEQGNNAAIGKVIGPSFYADEIPNVMSNIINTYVEQRADDESFIQTYQRLGVTPFKEAAYKDKLENAKKKEKVGNTVGEDAS